MSRPPTPQPTTLKGGDRITSVAAGLATALILVRFFLPAEAATRGETLWISALWLVLALGGSLLWIRHRWALTLDGLDVSVVVWMGLQIVSALALVVSGSGNRRDAMNLAWEWLGLGASWFLLRHGFAEHLRHQLVFLTTVTGTLLAGYGLYQHSIEHPQLVARYAPLFDRLRSATGAEAVTIRQQFAREGIPTEGPALVLFEKRFRDSQEPVGLFALANTFGGVLGVCLVLLLGLELRAIRDRRPWWMGWAAAAVVGTCLLLTKSRTAWVGTLVGGALLLARDVRSGRLSRSVKVAGLGLLALLVLAPVLLAVGALDRQVLTEAPKSLSYRIQYWQATGTMIWSRPWLGTGPGNFRQHYLHDKLPEASEEISDPHNLVLETAATGGILSAVGLLTFLGLALARSQSPNADALPETTGGNRFPASAAWLGGGAFVAFAAQLMLFGIWEDRLLILGLLWPAIAWLLRGGVKLSASAAAQAAAATLAVHLLGAGGIGMPAIVQLLLVLTAVCHPALRTLRPVELHTVSPRRWPDSWCVCCSTADASWPRSAGWIQVCVNCNPATRVKRIESRRVLRLRPGGIPGLRNRGEFWPIGR